MKTIHLFLSKKLIFVFHRYSMTIANLICDWYSRHKRTLPWRETSEPYLIWVSEIIMQQTRIEQGLPYYQRFITLFPDVTALAQASEDEVLHAWQGLGYYSRARNMHETAKQIVKRYNRRFPGSYSELLKLKGIGEYTAAAIASICFNEQVAAIDGNVNRVISRLFDISLPIDKTDGRKQIWEISAELIPKKNPSDYNQAMMDLGAGICTPKNPACSECPLISKCLAYKNKTVNSRPVKTTKTIQKSRYFNYLVFIYQNTTWIHKRIGNDIWKGLFEFPMIETTEKQGIIELFKSELLHTLNIQQPVNQIKITDMETHVLSHQLIHSRFIQIWLSTPLYSPQFIKIRFSELSNYAFPKLIDNYINHNGSENIFASR